MGKSVIRQVKKKLWIELVKQVSTTVFTQTIRDFLSVIYTCFQNNTLATVNTVKDMVLKQQRTPNTYLVMINAASYGTWYFPPVFCQLYIDDICKTSLTELLPKNSLDVVVFEATKTQDVSVLSANGIVFLWY